MAVHCNMRGGALLLVLLLGSDSGARSQDPWQRNPAGLADRRYGKHERGPEAPCGDRIEESTAGPRRNAGQNAQQLRAKADQQWGLPTAHGPFSGPTRGYGSHGQRTKPTSSDTMSAPATNAAPLIAAPNTSLAKLWVSPTATSATSATPSISATLQRSTDQSGRRANAAIRSGSDVPSSTHPQTRAPRSSSAGAGHTPSMSAPLIEFPADDPDRARRFWLGVLGVTLEPRPTAAGSGWQADTDGLRLGVHERGPGPGDTASLPYFTVADLAATLEHVRELGGSVIHPGDRWAVCRDSEGSPFALAAAPGPGE
jgi:predicted enzyme related to lactoylglutathione lyase